jgi:hypothetical protein
MTKHDEFLLRQKSKQEIDHSGTLVLAGALLLPPPRNRPSLPHAGFQPSLTVAREPSESMRVIIVFLVERHRAVFIDTTAPIVDSGAAGIGGYAKECGYRGVNPWHVHGNTTPDFFCQS